MVHAGDEYEEGWLVVEAQWYDLVQRSERGYRLLPDKKLIVVNAIVRLSGIQFSKAHMGTRGCHGEAIRTRNYGGLEILSEDFHNVIIEAMYVALIVLFYRFRCTILKTVLFLFSYEMHGSFFALETGNGICKN